jgi:hypothetical protein
VYVLFLVNIVCNLYSRLAARRRAQVRAPRTSQTSGSRDLGVVSGDGVVL